MIRLDGLFCILLFPIFLLSGGKNGVEQTKRQRLEVMEDHLVLYALYQPIHLVIVTTLSKFSHRLVTDL